jgi:predicted ABC-type transport system involved in lysophospholipase L1 biosynthesis ATPase subunit
MNGDVCLSGRDIERYVGEEESRVHPLRGVSLDFEFGSTHAVVGLSGFQCDNARG